MDNKEDLIGVGLKLLFLIFGVLFFISVIIFW